MITLTRFGAFLILCIAVGYLMGLFYTRIVDYGPDAFANMCLIVWALDQTARKYVWRRA